MRAAPKNIDICAEMRHQPTDLFGRHDNCDCIIVYDVGLSTYIL